MPTLLEGPSGPRFAVAHEVEEVPGVAAKSRALVPQKRIGAVVVRMRARLEAVTETEMPRVAANALKVDRLQPNRAVCRQAAEQLGGIVREVQAEQDALLRSIQTRVENGAGYDRRRLGRLSLPSPSSAL